MSKLQIVDAKKMERLLLLLGFEKTRQKGSHVFYKHSDGRTTTVPHLMTTISTREDCRSIF